MAIDPSGHNLVNLICFELKRGYNRATLHDLIDKPDGGAKQEWEKWIEQAEESCEAGGCYTWAIIARRDNRESIILIPEEFANQLSLAKFPNRFNLESYQHSITALRLDTFLMRVPPSFLKDLAKRV